MTSASHCFWKWADNDLPGRPNEVLADLVRGNMHPALQAFDPQPVVRELEKASRKGRRSGEEWDWQVCPDGIGNQARFVHLACLLKDNPNFSREPLIDRLDALGISGYDDQHGRLIECLSPKLNVFECEQWWDEPRYDVDAAELAVLLRRLRPNRQNPFASLTDRRGSFVSCMGYGRRFSVEWHERLDPHDWSQTAPWRLECFPVRGRRRWFMPTGVEFSRVKGSDWCRCFTGESDHETITFTETLAVFRSFLRGQPRPQQYRWCDISKELS